MIILLLLLQDEISVTTSYRAAEGTSGIAAVAGKTTLPDGAVLQVALIRLAYTAGVMSTRMTPLEVTPHVSVLVEARKGKFEHTFSVPACGEFRLRLSFKRKHQESQSVVASIGKTLKEFDVVRDVYLGTVEQFVAGLQRSLTEADAFQKKIQAALEELSRRDPAEVAGRFATLKSDLANACPRTSLLATLHAHIDTCSLFYNTLAFEGKTPRYSGGASGSSGSSAHIDSEEQAAAPAPAPSGSVTRRRGEVTVDLTHLERIACREAALVMAVAIRYLAEDSKALSKGIDAILVLHEGLVQSRPKYKSTSDAIQDLLKRIQEWLKESDAEKSEQGRLQIAGAAKARAEELQNLPK
jgi:hypothetical protein